MEDGPMHSGDSSLPRSLTDSDFQALSLEVAQARADARSAFLRRPGDFFPDSDCQAGDARDEAVQDDVVQDDVVQGDVAQTDDPLGDEFSVASRSDQGELLPSEAELIQQRLPSEDFAPVHCNLSIAELMEHALLRAEGVLSDRGALCVRTLPYSGMTPGSYFCVDPHCSTEAALAWGKMLDRPELQSEFQPESQSERQPPVRPGFQLAPLDESTFWAFYRRAVDYSEDKALYQCDGQFQGHGQEQAPGLRVICELASQAIMARHWLGPLGEDDGDQLLQGTESLESLAESDLELTVIALPGLKGEPLLEPLLKTEVFVLIHPAQRLALVGGSRHGGELRRAIAALFAEVYATELPSASVLSASVLSAGAPTSGGEVGVLCQDAVQVEAAPGQRSLFLGSLGSGKQTLAAAMGPAWFRGPLLGQAGGRDGWQPLLAGGYGNVTDLAPDAPLHQRLGFGAVLENVPLQEASSRPRFGDLASAIPFWATWKGGQGGSFRPQASVQGDRSRSVGDRARGAIPTEASGNSPNPSAIFLLVADVRGVLPAIARLTRAQMLYYLALGYGAELPGWNRHQLTPAAHFAGGNFLGTDPCRAVRDLVRWQEHLQAQDEQAFYLVNTGWLGAMEAEGRSLLQRIPVSVSETLVKAASAGDIPLHDPVLFPGQTCLDPVFGWTLPLGLQQLPGRWCQPWNVWGNVRDWRAEAIALATQCQTQIAQLVAVGLPPEIAQAGPWVLSDPRASDRDPSIES